MTFGDRERQLTRALQHEYAISRADPVVFTRYALSIDGSPAWSDKLVLIQCSPEHV